MHKYKIIYIMLLNLCIKKYIYIINNLILKMSMTLYYNKKSKIYNHNNWQTYRNILKKIQIYKNRTFFTRMMNVLIVFYMNYAIMILINNYIFFSKNICQLSLINYLKI